MQRCGSSGRVLVSPPPEDNKQSCYGLMEMLSWCHVTLQLFGKRVRILQHRDARPPFTAVVKAAAYKVFS